MGKLCIPGKWPSIRGFFPHTLDAEFAAFQRANPRFALQRLPRDDAARIIHYCEHPDAAAPTDIEQEAKAAAAEKYELIGDVLHVKARAAPAGGGSSSGGRTTGGGHEPRRVVYNANTVFRICAEAHLELRHGTEGATARAINQKFVGVNFDEVVWVVEHCLSCAADEEAHPTRSTKQSRRDRKKARRARARHTTAASGQEASTCLPQQLGPNAPERVTWQGRLYNPSPTVRVLVEVVDMGPKFMTGFRHALFLQDMDYRVSVVSALPAANNPAAVAQGIALWEVLRGPPQYLRFGLDGADANALASDTLRLLRQIFGIDCQLDTVPLPLTLPLMLTEDIVRGAIMAWLQRNGPAAWDVVLRGVTFDLNEIGRPGASTAGEVIRHFSGMMVSEPSAELVAGIEAMTIRGGDGDRA
jgi:hypothetical protein